MKKVLCTMLAVIMLITAMPLVSFASETVDVTIDITEHKNAWTEPKGVELGLGLKGDFVYTDELLEYSKITVECFDEAGNSETKIIDTRKTSGNLANLSFDTESAPEKLVIGLYLISVFDIYDMTNTSIYIESGLTVSAADKEPRIFTRNDADVTKEGFSAPFNMKASFLPLSGTAKMIYLQYTYNLNGENGGEYEIDENRYSFGNLYETIPLSIYQRAYGDVRGKVLYNHYENRKHGHCYGMAVTSAALLTNPDALSQFKAPGEDGEYAATMSDLTPEYTSDLFDTSLRDYIKYGNIYQLDKNVQEKRATTVNDINGLYNAVKAYVEGNSTPVTVSLYHTTDSGVKNGHEILITGIKETDSAYILTVNDADLYINDQQLVIDKNLEAWSYNVAGKVEYTSENAQLSYATPAEDIYNMGISLGKGESGFFSNSTLIVATDAVEPKTFIERLIELVFNSHGESEEEATGYAYWLEEGENEVELSSLADDNEITVADANTAIKVTVDNGDDAKFVLDSTESLVELSAAKGDESEIVFSISEDGEETEIIIKATADSSKVTATMTDDSFLLSGISDGEVTLTKNDEIIASEEIEDVYGDVVITYEQNDETGDVELDLHTHSYTTTVTVTDPTCSAEGYITYTCDCGDSYTDSFVPAVDHADADKDYKCDFGCGYEFARPTDSCLCHRTGIFTYIWKLLRIIYSTFNIKPVCYCGELHY